MPTIQKTENVITRKQIKLPASVSNVVEVSSGFEAPNPDTMKIIITGRPGCGKSSLLASNPNSVMYDLERNAGTVIDPQATRIRIKPTSRSAADDLKKSVEELVKAYRTDEALQSSLNMVSFDSVDSLVDTFLRDLCVKNDIDDPGEYGGGHGRGYSKVRTDMFEMFDSITQVGLGIALTGHLSLKEVNGTHLRTLNVSDSFKQHLLRWRHMMFRIELTSGKVTKKVGNKTIEVASKDPRDNKFILITDTSTTTEDFDSPKSHIPIESGLVIPAKNGWTTFRSAVVRAITQRQEESK